MDSWLCREASNIIREVAGDIMKIYDYSNCNPAYLWLYTYDEKMIGIVHGGKDKPYELKIINIGETKQKDFSFYNWIDFKDFLKNDMRNIVLALAL